MKKLLVLILAVGLIIGVGSSAYATSVGLGYGFFELENGADIDGLILETDSNFGNELNFESRYFMGDGDGNHEADLLDLRLYKKIETKQNNTDFYLGGGWKWLSEDNDFRGAAATTSQWGLPLSAKMETSFNNGFSFGAKADYWFIGSYEVESNFMNDFDGDFTGFAFDIYAEKTLTENFSIKLGYVNEDYTFGKDDSVGVSEFDNTIDGFYFAGLYNY